MMLVTKAIRKKLLKNGERRSLDHIPVLKIFNPCGAATWLFVSMDPEAPDLLYGLSDLGFGVAETGDVRLSELQSLKGRLGIGMERDRYFRAVYPLHVYLKAAESAGGIVETADLLDAAARRLGVMPQPPTQRC